MNILGTFNQNTEFLSIPGDWKSSGKNYYSGSIQVVRNNETTLFFMGDIYNIDESKAEKVLASFLKNGIKSVRNYDGEFTLIFVSEDETVIYRDRHGAGPQIYYTNNFYSSALRNFLEIKTFQPNPNIEGLLTFLSIGYIPSPMSSLMGVKKIPAGNVLIVKNGKQTLEPLYTWTDFQASCNSPRTISEEAATLEYEQLHKKAIEARIQGKKHVGLLLSGGYDSGGNIAGLRDVYSGEASSYSIGFKDNPWTELPLAKIMSVEFGTKHTEYEIDGSEIRELPAIVNYLGDPFQEGGLMVNYAAMRLIGDTKPEVILGGDGNDQHFGTAGKELAMNYTMRKKGLAPFQNIYSRLGRFDMFNRDNILFRTQFHNEKILNIQKSDNFGFKPHQLEKLITTNSDYGPDKYLADLPSKFSGFDEFYFVHNYFGDIRQVINEVILFKASKMSAMFGNSLSFPYLSTDIYEFLKLMPRELKCKGSVKEISQGKGVTKFLHKNYLKPKLPSEITDRKKQGGFAPLPIFFKEDVRRRNIQDFILSSSVARELFSEKYLKNFFREYDESVKSTGYWFWYKQVKAFQFFNLLVLSIWWEMFINRKNIQEIKNAINI
ncbi:MAG: hypothetical protein JXR61_10190 [Prolixibacteraceae bacterium]|nr:hypothetical protein [Prolixibacteraceae bacterium]